MARFTEKEARWVMEKANDHVRRELFARNKEESAEDDTDKEMYAVRAKIESELSTAIVDLFEEMQGIGGEWHLTWNCDEMEWMLYKRIV